MARKKTAKRASKAQATKRSPVKKATPELELMQTPARLAAKLDKEITGLRKSDTKLKAAVIKAKAQVKKAEAKAKSLAKAKVTAASKKQASVAKKAVAALTANVSALSKQHDAVVKSLASSVEQQAKLIALGKHLAQFEKEWAKKVRLQRAKIKAKANSRKKAVQETRDLDNIDALSHEQTETTHDVVTDIATDESTEKAA